MAHGLSWSAGSPAARLKAGDCFETAMRWAYRAALCAPDFLYHVEPPGELDDHALACRLSYFFWNSMPDEKLTAQAASGKLRKPEVLRAEVERLLADVQSRSEDDRWHVREQCFDQRLVVTFLLGQENKDLAGTQIAGKFKMRN